MPLAVLNEPTFYGATLAILLAAALLSAAIAWRASRRGDRLGRRLAELESQLVELRRGSLKRTLRHHFLLNTLNLISSQMRESVDKADSSIAHLGALLRSSLESSERGETTLGEELELLEHYLAIARARFGSRIRTRQRVDAGCARALVPQLLLQPLVENSVWHVVAKASFPHVITVSARRLDDRLRLRITDDGPGSADLACGRLDEGTGLTVTRRRLQLQYGNDQSLTIGNRPSGGLEVVMDLPYRERERDDDTDADRRRRAASA